MAINGAIVPICDVLGTTAAGTVTIPVSPNERGVGSERTAAGKQTQLNVSRSDIGGAALVGNVGVYGFDISNPNTGTPLGNAFATPITPDTQSFTSDGTTTSFTADTLLVPAAVSPNIVQQNVVVETELFTITATNATSVSAAATGVVTVTGGDLTGATAAMVPLLPEVDVGDVVTITGTINGVAGQSITGIVTVVTSATQFTWDQTAVITLAKAVNKSPSKRLKLVLASGAAGPRAVNMASAAAAAPVVVFAVAPPAWTMAERPAVSIYVGSPVELLTAGTHSFERVRVRSRSIIWARFTGIQTAANRTQISLTHLVE